MHTEVRFYSCPHTGTKREGMLVSSTFAFHRNGTQLFKKKVLVRSFQFEITTDNYLGIILTKEEKNLLDEKYKTLRDRNKKKNLSN